MKNKPYIIASILLSVLFLYIFTISRWYINNISDTKTFTKNMVQVLQTQEVRDVVSEAIIEKTLADYPLVLRLASEYLQPGLSGVLASPQAETIFTKAISAVHASSTSPQPYDITIDITRVKRVVVILSTLVDLATDNQTQKVDPNKIPDEIVLISKNDIPSIYPVTVTVAWLGPLAGLGFVLLLGLAFYKSEDKITSLKVYGGVLAFFSIMMLLGLPYLKNIILSYTYSDIQKVIINSFYEITSQGLIRTIQIYTVIGLSLLVIGYSISSRIYKKIPGFPKDKDSNINTSSSTKKSRAKS